MELKNFLTRKAPTSHDLVLIGGGHSQITVLKKFGMKPIPGLRITLINKDFISSYSGMLPGYIAETYDRSQTEIDLLNLCKFSNSRLVIDKVIGLDLDEKLVILENRAPIIFDTLSINSGGEPNLGYIKGANEFSIPIKPISKLVKIIDGIKEKIKKLNGISISVVGGGAGGIELALALTQYLKTKQNIKEIEVNLISKGQYLAKAKNKISQNTILSFLKNNNINVILNEEVIEFGQNFIKTSKGTIINSKFNFLVTPISAPKWMSETGLSLDNSGFIRVNKFLQTSNENIFASGDVSSFENKNLPKAGVYAVRQGPILFKNLRAKILNYSLTSFKPQSSFLSLIGNGKDEAIFSWKGISFKSKFAWMLKRYIDESFMKKYNHLNLMKMESIQPHPKLISKENKGDPALEKIRCLGCGAKSPWISLNNGINSIKENLHSKSNKLNNVTITSDASIIDVPSGNNLVQSVDLISAIVNDPYTLSRIAAIHAISDVLSASATPMNAEAIFILPPGLQKIQSRLISELLNGATYEFNSHNIKLNGGHTSEGEELQVGFCISGIRPKSFKSKEPKVGDKLILTKPLGTGVILAANMRLKINPIEYKNTIETMLNSNLNAANIIRNENISAITDVTGFGLARHTLNLTKPFGANLSIKDIPVLSGALEHLSNNINSSLAFSNKKAINFTSKISKQDHIIFDPQTSGGLLVSVNKVKANQVLEKLKKSNHHASIIGEVIEKHEIILN